MYFQSEKIFSDENIILGLTFQPMLDLVVIAEIAEIDSTIEMTTVIIIETTMVKIVLKVKKFFVKHENILKDPFTDYIGVLTFLKVSTLFMSRED